MFLSVASRRVAYTASAQIPINDKRKTDFNRRNISNFENSVADCSTTFHISVMVMSKCCIGLTAKSSDAFHLYQLFIMTNEIYEYMYIIRIIRPCSSSNRFTSKATDNDVLSRNRLTLGSILIRVCACSYIHFSSKYVYIYE